jgi:hypothetical protein
MLGGTRVASLLVALACVVWGVVLTELVATIAVDPDRFSTTTRCAACGGALEPAVDWTEYVRFLEA